MVFRVFTFAIIFISTLSQAQTKKENIQVAFLADVHFQDLYGNLDGTNYKGIVNPKDGKYTLLRTMDAQLHSTRIFNENYFAFIAALDDIAKRGIHYVALPGDYSDDGQPIHVRGLQRILDEYSAKYKIQFFITTGNHDPVGPFAQEAGKDDFLGKGGQRQAIYSKTALYKPKTSNDLPVVISSDIAKMGYTGITEYLHDFGFFPQKNYLYWSTPFSTYTAANYNFGTALEQSKLEKRFYEVAPGFLIPDVSYVVEPVEGLWLLAIDGNVYLPKNNGDAADPKTYKGADLGYNNVLTNKKHLINWVQQVAADAKKMGKTLIAFSHYPMVEFNDGASPDIESLMGKGKWQLDRVPVEEVAQTFADAGVQVHFGGHMHINDTGMRISAKGNTLFNIQTPSLAAYIPAYKLLTIKSDNVLEVETITIDKVPGFDALFPLYEMEYSLLKSRNEKDIWNRDILKTKSYHDFTNFHLKELVRLRFLPDDWPSEFKDFILKLSGEDLLLLAYIDSYVSFDLLFKNKIGYGKEWKLAGDKVKRQLAQEKLKLKDFKKWKGLDLITDFYRIRSADELALADISEDRIQQYKILVERFMQNKSADTDVNRSNLKVFFSILHKFLNGDPANHFSIDLKTGTIKNIRE